MHKVFSTTFPFASAYRVALTGKAPVPHKTHRSGHARGQPQAHGPKRTWRASSYTFNAAFRDASRLLSVLLLQILMAL